MKATRRWDLWGLAAGLALGAADMGTFVYFGADVNVAGRDLMVPLGVIFVGIFGSFGYTAGRVAMGRARARADAETIQRQMGALEATQHQVLENEKLAAIGRLAAGVAHEVRNPLGVIRASASMIQEGLDPEDDAYRACGFIREEIDRLNGLISSLLDYARPAELATELVALKKVVDRALDLAAEKLRAGDIALVRESLGAVPDVPADPHLLAQVVLGLVINAAEAVGGGGRVALRIHGDDRVVCLEVADSGPGVAPADADRVFEPFFTTKPRGTGLGLAMAARIVKAHRGAIEAVQGAGAGEGGSGACFRIRLPLRSGPAAEFSV